MFHVDNSSALYLDLGNGTVGYSPSWMVSDQPESGQDSIQVKHRKEFRAGTLHEVRLVQYNSLDGVAIVSLRESVLEKRYMKYSDIHAGDFVEGSVERVCDFGVIVAITGSIHGLCPSIHVSDLQTVISNPSKRYKCGAKVKCRVLNVTPATRQLLLTCKRSLLRLDKSDSKDGVGSEGEGETTRGGRKGRVLCAYSSAKPGDCYTGVVTSVYSYGCVVHFFGQVRGFVHRKDMNSPAALSNPASEYWEGQSVECRVLSCMLSSEKLSLSFKLDAEESDTAGMNRATGDEVATPPLGAVTSGKRSRRLLGAEASDEEASGLASADRDIKSATLTKHPKFPSKEDPNRVAVGDIISVMYVVCVCVWCSGVVVVSWAQGPNSGNFSI